MIKDILALSKSNNLIAKVAMAIIVTVTVHFALKALKTIE